MGIRSKNANDRSSRTLHWLGFVMTMLAFALLGSAGATAQSADDPAKLEDGETVYVASCAGCHGADGMGTQNGRSLISIADAEADRTVHIQSVTDGKGNMPSFGDKISEEDIDAAVTYVRLTFLQQADADMEELPLTGLSSDLAYVGGLLLLAGVALLAAPGLVRQRLS